MAVYYWQGGATGTAYLNDTNYGPDNYDIQKKSRFDWNRRGNWRVSKSSGIGTMSTGALPAPGDSVYIGSPVLAGGQPIDFTVQAPLLFGGFNGGISGGYWTRPFQVNPSLSGTTWTSSLQYTNIGWRGGPPFHNPSQLSSAGATFSFAYPFPLIGGGITSSTIELMKGVYVEGMTYSDWDIILAGSTLDREKELKIKSNYFQINPLGDSIDYKINWNPSAGLSGQWYENYGTTNTRTVNINIVDNYGNDWTRNAIATWISINAENSLVYLNNAKLLRVATNTVGHPVYKEPARVILKNCVAGYITSYGNPVYIETDKTCIIGTFNYSLYSLASDWGAPSSYNNKPLAGDTVVLSGKFDPVAANTAIGFLNTSYGVTYESIQFYVIPGTTGYGLNVRFGNSQESGTTFNSWPITADSTNPNLPINLFFDSGSSVSTIDLNNATIQASNTIPLSDNITISTLTLKNSTLNLAANPAFNNWRFGSFTGNTMIGGIQFGDSNSIIKGDAGVRLLNYAVFNKAFNWRTGGIYLNANQAFPETEIR